MLTEEEILGFSACVRDVQPPEYCDGLRDGATWANDQNYIEIARLEAEKEEILFNISTALDRLRGEESSWPMQRTPEGILAEIVEKYGKNA